MSPGAALLRVSSSARPLAARLLLGALLVALGLLAPGPALAQSQPRMTTRVSSPTVEVGELFTVELKAMVERGAPEPSSPDLRPPGGFTMSGPQVSTQTIAQFGPGGSTIQIGLGATWQLVASSPGHYVIPAPTVTWNGRRLRGDPIPVDVVPSSPNRPRQQAIPSPFLMPGGPGFGFPLPSDPGASDPLDDDGSGVPELAMPKAPDPYVFLHAIVDKKSAVVGEQVTISFYCYRRVPFSFSERHEASLSDFLRVPLLKNPGSDPVVHAVAGGHRYEAQLLDRIALFPVHAGDLHTGSMSGRFTARQIGSQVLYESEDLVVHVTEPPREGRPPGYVVGDVGQFVVLGGGVQPRKIDEGGSLSVTIRVSGTGNLPQSLHLPERNGVDWLDPEKKDAVEPQGGVVGGWRTFGYVVRIKRAGTVALGAVELPFWDPANRRYQTARFDLGTVEVAPVYPTGPAASAASSPEPPGKVDPFAAIGGPRLTLQAFPPAAAALPLEGPRFWGALALPPALVGLFFAWSALARRVRARRAGRASQVEVIAAQALREAARAESAGSPKELASALERALHAAIERAAGLKSRGVLLDDLPAELARRGLDPELGEEVRAALAACEAIRFDPEGAAAAADLGKRARGLVAELGRRSVRRDAPEA